MARPRAVASILRLDLRGIARHGVALSTIALSLLGTLAITVLGLFQQRVPVLVGWFPFIVAVTLIGGPGGWGLLFGMLLVEESETGVRQALAVTPLRPMALTLTRAAIATVWMCIWPMSSVWLMNATWHGIHLPLRQLFAVVGPLALLTPTIAIFLPTLASDKLGALAVFKAVSFVTLLPLALYIVSPRTWYEPLFLLSPTAWVVQTYRAFVSGNQAPGWRLAGGSATYALLLFGVTARAFSRRTSAPAR